MIQVVIDTNIVVSANLVDVGPSAAILDLAVNQKIIRMCISPAVLKEYNEVLRRPRLKLPAAQIEESLALIIDAARMVYPAKTLNISGDESDNRFYECADAAGADYLVTGNTQDFTRGHAPPKSSRPATSSSRSSLAC